MAFVDELNTLGFTWFIPLDETSGTTANADISSENYTYGSGATLNQTGCEDGGSPGVSFDGSSAQNWVENQSPVDGTDFDNTLDSDRVIFIGFNLDTTAKDQLLYYQGGRNQCIGIYITDEVTTDQLRVNFNDSGTHYNGAGDAPSTGACHSVIVVKDGNTITCYLDGTSLFTIDATGMTALTVTEVVVIGDSQGTGGNSDRFRFHSGSQKAAGTVEVDGLITEVAYKSNGTITAQQAEDLHDFWLNGASGGALVHFGNETVEITEGSLALMGMTRFGNETVSITEVSQYVRGRIQAAAETIAITEGSLNFLGLVRLAAETVGITEGTLKFLGLVREAGETVSITEGTLRNLGLARIVNETVDIIDGILRSRGLVRVIDSTVGILEGTLRFLGIVRVANETVEILEGSLFFQGLVRVANETVIITGAFVSKVMEAGFGALEYARYTIVPKVCASAYKIVSKVTGKYKTSGNDEVEF